MKNVITLHPNKDLFEHTREIPKDQIQSETYTQIGAAMLEVLRGTNGIGLSANQVGLPLKMCVIELNKNDPLIMLNPRITKMSDKTVKSQEGCLSLPGADLTINRHSKVTAEYEDVTGETKTLEATGLLANCLQHEIDHLNGILIINRVNHYYKSKALKQVQRHKKIYGNQSKKAASN